MAQPRVTLVVVPREQFSVAERSLESIFAHTPEPFELVYVDGRSPPALAAKLRAEAARRGFRLLRSERYLSPNRARNWALQHVHTEYVVFVDNDLIASPGWLAPLLACAEETGAWAVGPLYLEGDPADGIVHMAGGSFTFEGTAPRRRFETRHLLQKERLADLPQPLVRGECDFVEFHCMLLRRDVIDRLGPLDEGLLNTREHLDLCIQIREAGGTVWFEPASVVTYKSPPPLEPRDVPFFLLRWSEEWTLRSLRHFAAKYGIERSYERRAYIAAARRSLAFEPLSRWVRPIAGERAERAVAGAVLRVERVANRLLVRGHTGTPA